MPENGELEWERRLGPRVGAAALIAAAFVLVSFFVQLPLLRERTKNEAETLRSVHRHGSAYVTAGILQLVTMALLLAVFYYLYRAARYRRDRTPPVTLVLALIGPVIFGIAGAISPFVVKHIAAEFAASANQSNQHAKDLVSGSAAQVFGIVTPIGGLIFALAAIMTNVNSMRAGLVSTFTGIIGVIAGLLFVLPLGPPQLLLFFWLAFVGVILLDRWPGGRGPAWESGKADRWPTAAERRAALNPAGAQPPEPADEPTGPTRTSRKRKRKQGRKR